MLKQAASDDEKVSLNTSSQSLQYQNYVFFLEIILKCLLLNLDLPDQEALRGGGDARLTRETCCMQTDNLRGRLMFCDYPVH